MKFNIILFASLFTFCMNAEFEKRYFQNKYSLKFERAIVVSQNSDLMNVTIKNYKYNRTTTFANVTFAFYEDVQSILVHIVGYKQSVNVYTKTAVQFNANACTVLKKNAFGYERFKTEGNFTNCPIHKGVYVVPNFSFPAQEMPPNIPEGNWKVRGNTTVNGKFGVVMDIYVNLVYPV